MSSIHGSLPSDTAAPADAAARTSRWRLVKPRTYLLLLVLVLLATLGYRLRFEGIFSCQASGYSNDTYLSNCQATHYGDYDHGAWWFGLEPQASQSMAKAQVLFLGNSRMQEALSSPVTARWFAESSVPYYLLGIAQWEDVLFVQPLLTRLQPRPKVLVINMDRFFADFKSAPLLDIMAGGDIEDRYRDKQRWQKVHAAICGNLPALCGNHLGVYRSRSTGTWQLTGYRPNEGLPVADAAPSDVERWGTYAKLGESFLASLPVDRQCVILTVVPTIDTKRAEAKAIADLLGLDLVAPQPPGLRLFDGSHLDDASAERWALAFFAEAGPRIRACLNH